MKWRKANTGMKNEDNSRLINWMV